MEATTENVITRMSEIVEKGVETTQVIVCTLDECDTLTPIQKEALSAVFDDVKDAVQHIIIDADVPIQVKIMQIISRIIKSVQVICAAKDALTGADKKAIALECGRKCIKMMLKDHLDMLMLYETIAEPALETMLDLSHKMRPHIMKPPSQSCCVAVFKACMGLKR